MRSFRLAAAVAIGAALLQLALAAPSDAASHPGRIGPYVTWHEPSGIRPVAENTFPGSRTPTVNAMIGLHARSDAAQPDAGGSDMPVPGELPVGRVLQNVGLAGYSFDATQAANSVSFTFVAPSAGCNPITGAPPAPWPNGMSFASAFVNADVGPAGIGVWLGCSGVPANYGYGTIFSSSDPLCYRNTCPLRQLSPGISPGDIVSMSVSTDGVNATSTITDETTGQGLVLAHGVGGSGPTPQVNLLVTDECQFYAGGNEPCANAVPNGQSSVPPPGFSSYSPIAFTDATVDGEDLTSAQTTGAVSDWYQINSVYGTTLLDETTPSSGGTFTVTDSDRQLPALQIAPGPNVEVGAAPQQLPFVVSLSQSSNDQIYIDYSTADVTAAAGVNYAAVSGTLSFPPGTTSQTVEVPVLAGDETGQGLLQFLFALSNPSYVGFGQAEAAGGILTGPVVYSVSPTVLPNVGPEPVTVTGDGFGNPGAGDAVQFCNAAGSPSNCVDGQSVVVDSGQQISLQSPNAASIVDADEAYTKADTIVTDTHGVSSPRTTADEVSFGCDQQIQSDGTYFVAACVTPTTVDGVDVTEQQGNFDGIYFSASPTDQVQITNAAGTSALTSSGPVKLWITVAGKRVNLYAGPLNQNLNGQAVYTVKGSAGGFVFAGPMTVTGSGSTAMGQVPVVAPNWLGGGTAMMTFNTVVNGGSVSNLEVTMASGSFANLFPLSNVVFSGGNSEVWSILGQVGGASGPTLSGDATYSGTTLQSASMGVPFLPLFGGVVNVTGISVSYTDGAGWTGSATASPDGGGNVAITFNAAPGGKPLGGSITVTSPYALGEFPTNLLTFSLSGDTWSVSGTIPGIGKGLTGSMSVTKGVLQSGSVKVSKLPLFDNFLKLTGSLSYTLSAQGNVWTGTIGVKIPEEEEVQGGQGIVVSMTVVNGIPAAGTVTLSNALGVPLADGLLLTQLGIGVQWYPNLSITSGSVGLGLGVPVVGVGPLMNITGSITRENNPPVGQPDSTQFSGTLEIMKQTVGSATATLADNGADNVTLNLGDSGQGISVGPVNIQAKLTGTVGATKMTLTGTGTVTGPGFSIDTKLYMDATGMAACSGGAGFQWIWGQTPTTTLSGCSVSGF